MRQPWCRGELYDCCESWDIQARLSEIGVPTLVTCGRYDFCTPAQAELIHNGIPASELVIFEESSQYAHVEETSRYLAVLHDFMTRIEQQFTLSQSACDAHSTWTRPHSV